MSIKHFLFFLPFWLMVVFSNNARANTIEDSFLFDELINSIDDDMTLKHCTRRKAHEHDHWYNVHASKEKKFIWFRVFKVASGTIRGVLKSQVSDLTQSRPAKISSEYKKYFKFAFVRNPWSRVLSCYFHKILTKKSKEFEACFEKDFDFFVDYISKIDLSTANAHIKLQTKLIPIHQCDFIGKMENLAEGLQYVCDQIGIEMQELGHRHQTDHAHYSTYYTPRTRQIIARLYREDIETFGYEFENKEN